MQLCDATIKRALFNLAQLEQDPSHNGRSGCIKPFVYTMSCDDPGSCLFTHFFGCVPSPLGTSRGTTSMADYPLSYDCSDYALTLLLAVVAGYLPFFMGI